MISEEDNICITDLVTGPVDELIEAGGLDERKRNTAIFIAQKRLRENFITSGLTFSVWKNTIFGTRRGVGKATRICRDGGDYSINDGSSYEPGCRRTPMRSTNLNSFPYGDDVPYQGNLGLYVRGKL